MRGDHICIAGLDLATMDRVRPVTRRDDELTSSILRRNGGPLAVGEIVEVGTGRPSPNPPEIEDYLIRTDDLESVGRLDPDEFFATLRSVAEPSLLPAFGGAVSRDDHTNSFTCPVNTGAASLAIVDQSWDWFATNAGRRLRLVQGSIDAGDEWDRTPINAIEFYEQDLKTVDGEAVGRLESRLTARGPVLVLYGLTREWKPADDPGVPRHWLQVNGIVFPEPL